MRKRAKLARTRGTSNHGRETAETRKRCPLQEAVLEAREASWRDQSRCARGLHRPQEVRGQEVREAVRARIKAPQQKRCGEKDVWPRSIRHAPKTLKPTGLSAQSTRRHIAISTVPTSA